MSDGLPYLGNIESYKENSFMTRTMYGVRRLFSSMFNLKEPIEFQFTDGLKRTLNVRDKTTYPRMFFKITGVRKAKERISGLAMSRSGITAQADVGEGVKNATLFPIDFNIEFHYIHTDAPELMQMVELLAMLTFTPKLSFGFEVGRAFEHTAQVKFEDDIITINEFNLEEGVDPGTSEIIMPFIVYSYVGLVTDRPWVHVVGDDDPVKINTTVGGQQI